jgi:putative flippase GtrA
VNSDNSFQGRDNRHKSDLGHLSMFSLKRKFLLFLVVGCLNTVFSYLIYAGLLFMGVSYSLAILGAYILGIGFNFRTTGRWVFKNRDNRPLALFIAVYIGMYLLSVLSVKGLLLLSVNKYIAGMIITLPMAVGSYKIMDKYVFRKYANVSGQRG